MTTSPDRETSLRQAGDTLFAAFAHYRGHDHWGDGLDNKSREDDLSVVRNTVRRLPDHHYTYYGWHAVSLGQTETLALKYFFPRVLYEEAFPQTYDFNMAGHLVPLEMYIDNLNQHDWHRWPDKERAPISLFVHKWFLACLAYPLRPYADPDAPYRAQRCASLVLRYASFLGIDTAPFLADWARDESDSATSHILDAFREHGTFITTHATLAHWDEIWRNAGAAPEAIHKVVRFLVSPRTYSRLERAFFAATDATVQQELADAVDLLRNTYAIWRDTLTGTGQIPGWAEEIAAQRSTPR